MNEDTKTKLEEKKDAVIGEKELKKVAGGNYYQNLDILNALMPIDAQSVGKVFSLVNKAKDETEAQYIVGGGAQALFNKHFGSIASIYNPTTGENKYTFKGKEISHDEMLEEIKNEITANTIKLKVQGWQG